MPEKLPIKKILLEALSLSFKNYKQILKLTWPYIIISLIIINPNENYLSIIALLLLILSIIASILAYVSCHKIFLLSKNDTIYSAFSWSEDNTMYFIKVIKISLRITLILIPFLLIIVFITPFFENILNITSDKFIGLTFLLPSMYLFSRYSLILPGSAVSNNHTLSWSWKVSQSNDMRLFFLIGIIPSITSIVFNILNTLFEPTYIILAIDKLIWLIVALIELCILSLAYKHLNPNYLENDTNIQEEKDDFKTVVSQTENAFKLSVQENDDISFEKLKTELYDYYKKLDFTNLTLDKEESWMIKNIKNKNAYILLSRKDTVITLEVYNSVKPDINILKDLI